MSSFTSLSLSFFGWRPKSFLSITWCRSWNTCSFFMIKPSLFVPWISMSKNGKRFFMHRQWCSFHGTLCFVSFLSFLSCLCSSCISIFVSLTLFVLSSNIISCLVLSFTFTVSRFWLSWKESDVLSFAVKGIMVSNFVHTEQVPSFVIPLKFFSCPVLFFPREHLEELLSWSLMSVFCNDLFPKHRAQSTVVQHVRHVER